MRRGIAISAGAVGASCLIAFLHYEAGKRITTGDPLVNPPEAGLEGQPAASAAIEYLDATPSDTLQRVEAIVSNGVSSEIVDERPDQKFPSVRPDDLPLPKNRAFEVIREKFLAERREVQWSAVMESRILDLIANSSAESGFIDIQVECRTSLCRIQLSFAGYTQGDLPPDFSVVATMHGYRLRRSISSELDLGSIAFDSGFVSTIPTSLFFLERRSNLSDLP